MTHHSSATSTTERSSRGASSRSRELAALRIDRPVVSRSSGVGVRLVILLLVLCVLGGAAAAAWQFRDRLAPPPLVKTDTVRVMTMGQASTVLTATGYLEARWQASVGANGAGRVEEISFEEGTKVKKGDLLAVLEHSQLSATLVSRQVAVEQAQAVLAEAENVLEQDNRDLARARTLRQSQAVSQAEVETTETAARVSAIRVAAMKAALAAARAHVRETEVAIDNMHVYAPFAGTVVAKDAELGETILPGGMGAASGRGSVATIADLDHLEVDTDVKEDYLGQIEKGQPADVIVDAVPQKTYRGRLREIIPMGDRSRGVVKVKVSVLDPDEKLFPDLSATVHFLPRDGTSTAGSEVTATYVPAAALVERDGQTIVWRLDADQHVEGVAVNVKGQQKDGLVTIEGQLSGGDTVIVDPAPEIAAGMRVRTVE